MQASKLNAYVEYHYSTKYSIRVKNVKLLVISETESSQILKGLGGGEHPATLGPHPSK